MMMMISAIVTMIIYRQWWWRRVKLEHINYSCTGGWRQNSVHISLTEPSSSSSSLIRLTGLIRLSWLTRSSVSWWLVIIFMIIIVIKWVSILIIIIVQYYNATHSFLKSLVINAKPTLYILLTNQSMQTTFHQVFSFISDTPMSSDLVTSNAMVFTTICSLSICCCPVWCVIKKP